MIETNKKRDLSRKASKVSIRNTGDQGLRTHAKQRKRDKEWSTGFQRNAEEVREGERQGKSPYDGDRV
eukprot:6183290-Pleurochrysis_carterae.AAC.3